MEQAQEVVKRETKAPDIIIGIVETVAPRRLSVLVDDQPQAIDIRQFQKWIQDQMQEFTERHEKKMATVASTVETGTTTAAQAKSNSRYAVYIAIITGITSISATIVTVLLTHYLSKGSE
jgi:3-oxoacyl-ACP reductase-like protein